jgi:hypothetical protein
MYWPRPEQRLSATKGMHRFVWDLTYPAPEVLSRDFPISAIPHDTPLYPQGALALPGHYYVTLTVESHLDVHNGNMPKGEQPFVVTLDPRVKLKQPNDLDRQFELDRKIAEALHRDYEALQQVRSVRAQLKPFKADHYANSASSNTARTAIAKKASELDAKAAALAGGEGGYGTRYLSTPEGRSLARLNGGFGAMLAALDTADAAPTTQQTAMFEEMAKALDEQLSTWNQVTTKDIPELNQQLKKASLPQLDIQKKVAADSPDQNSEDED